MSGGVSPRRTSPYIAGPNVRLVELLVSLDSSTTFEESAVTVAVTT